VSRYPYLLAELLGSGRWTEADLQKLVGKNLIRVFKKVEEVSFPYNIIVPTKIFMYMYRLP
jgi:hypothetical protein